MNCRTFEIIIVCNGYSKYLRASLYYWSQMNYPRDYYKIIVISSIKDQETISVCNAFNNKFNLELITYPHEDFHHKGKLIKKASEHSKAEYVFFTDADILFYPDTLQKINVLLWPNKDEIYSSYREDISALDINNFFNRLDYEIQTEEITQNIKISWPWENMKKEILYPSPFMGWMMIFHSKYLEKIDFQEVHSGYDEIDWKIFGQLLNMKLNKKIIELEYSPLHIYHGFKGVNWAGIKI